MSELVLRKECSWCGKVIREGDPGAPTSHGICEACTIDVERRAKDGSKKDAA